MCIFLNKKVAVGLLLSCILFLVFSFCACTDSSDTDENEILIGTYELDGGVIEIKSNEILSIENIDLSSLQAQIDSGAINFSVSEYLQGDLEYITLENDPTQIFIHMHEGLYATMVYDYQNLTITFLQKVYYFKA